MLLVQWLGGKKLSPRVTKVSAPKSILPGVPTALLFSPHPDDECIAGGLALRLAREAKWNVVNVAVTLGSKRERKNARRRELARACAALGFGLVVPGKLGLSLAAQRWWAL